MDLGEVSRFIRGTSPHTRVYVGCDSVLRSRSRGLRATYATVVVVHLDASRGCKVFGQLETVPDPGSMRQRLMQEAWRAGSVAMVLRPSLEGRTMEVHLDINSDPNEASSIALREAAGYIFGLVGINPRFKPHATIATTCADRFARLAAVA